MKNTICMTVNDYKEMYLKSIIPESYICPICKSKNVTRFPICEPDIITVHGLFEIQKQCYILFFSCDECDARWKREDVEESIIHQFKYS